MAPVCHPLNHSCRQGMDSSRLADSCRTHWTPFCNQGWGQAPRVGLPLPHPGKASQCRDKRPMTVDDDSAAVNFSPVNEHEEDFSAEMDFSTGNMDGGGYFTNLINDGYNSNCGWADMGSQSQCEVPRDVERNTLVRPNHRRTKNFSDEEDTLLVSAWLNISLNAV
uniref:Uncharacterized protein n=1 Tax=Leersia perrieri TaxID=77586 RepID=A0A0D9W4K5_9ORYZ